MIAEKRKLFFSFHKVTSYSMHNTDRVAGAQTHWHHTTCLCWDPLEVGHPCKNIKTQNLPERDNFTGTTQLMSAVECRDTQKLTCT